MRKVAIPLIVIVALGAFWGLLRMGSLSPISTPETMPKDFGFVAKWGVDGKNELDTFKGIYKKDLVMDGIVSTELRLTDDQMSRIFERMRQINIMGTPSSFARPFGAAKVSPNAVVSLNVTMNGRQKTILFDSSDVIADPRAKELHDLVWFIDQVIQESEAARKLPQPRGAYL